MTPPSIGARAALALGAGLVALALGPGCALPVTPSAATVPRDWRGTNTWGPEANALRAEGALPPRFYTPRMAAWADFARAHLQEGDLLFRLGRSYRLTGIFTSRLLAKISDGSFSHNGLVHWEGDTAFVYDAEQEGIRKVPFEFWMLDVADDTLAVKRLRPEFRHAVPRALAYCEDAYQRQVPFDLALSLDDERLYCSEMIEKAFASAGLPLAAPVPIRCLPRYARYGPLRPLVEALTEIRVDIPVYALGNERYGTYGSPCLELVYRGRGVNRYGRGFKAPTCEAP
jgi:hypothetical protein